jgi:hypothetical protein
MQKTLNQHVLHELIPPVSERMPPLIKSSGVRVNSYGPQVHAWSGDLWLESPHYPLIHPSELEEQQRKSGQNTPTTSSYRTFFSSTLYQKDAPSARLSSDSEQQEDQDSLLSPHLIARCLSPFPPVSTKTKSFYSSSKSMHSHNNSSGLMSPILSPVSAASSNSSSSMSSFSASQVHHPRARTASHKSQKSLEDSSFFSSFFESSVILVLFFFLF